MTEPNIFAEAAKQSPEEIKAEQDSQFGPPAPPLPSLIAYDSNYKSLVHVTPEELDAEPDRFQKPEAQETRMIGPDGKIYPVLANNAVKALQNGWSFLSAEESIKQTKIDAHLKNVYDSAATVGASQLTNQMLFGVPDIIDEHILSPEQLAAKNIGKERHQAANISGGVAGFALGAFLTGGIGEAVGNAAERAIVGAGTQEGALAARGALEAAAPGLATRLLGKAASGAAQGAMYSAPSAIAQGAYGDVEQAAETLAWGIGTGGLLGLGAGAISEGVQAGKGALRNQAVKAGLLDEATGAVNSGKFTELSEQLSRAKSTTPEELTKLKTSVAEQLSEHASKLDSAIEKAPKDIQNGLNLNSKDLAIKVGDTILETRPGLKTPMFSGEREQVTKIVQTIAKSGNDLTFKETNGLKNLFAESLGPNLEKPIQELSNKDKIFRQAYNLISDHEAEAMSKAYNKLGLTKDYAEYLATKGQQAALTGEVNPLVTGGMNTLAKKATDVLPSIGSVVGHTVGGGLGGMAGYTAGKAIAGKILPHLVDKGLDVGSKVLKKIADSPDASKWFGAALAKGANDGFLSKLTSLPVQLGAQASATVVAPSILGVVSGKKDAPKEEQFQHVSDALVKAKANPDLLKEQMDAVGSMFSHDPKLQAVLAGKQQATIDYLYQNLPKDPNPNVPFHFEKWQPSAAERKTFEAKLEVAYNPWSVIDHIQAGDLSKEHIEALNTLYPSLKEQMVGAVAQMAHDPNSPQVSNGIKHGLSMLTGIELNNPNNINYQTAYQGQAQQGQGPAPKSPKHIKINNLPSMTTGVQHRSFGGK